MLKEIATSLGGRYQPNYRNSVLPVGGMAALRSQLDRIGAIREADPAARCLSSAGDFVAGETPLPPLLNRIQEFRHFAGSISCGPSLLGLLTSSETG